MKRRYTVATIDERTGEAGWAGTIIEAHIRDAIEEGQRQGAMEAGHAQVRVSMVAEQEPGATAAAMGNIQRQGEG